MKALFIITILLIARSENPPLISKEGFGEIILEKSSLNDVKKIFRGGNIKKEKNIRI
jgi:hypothetical protein